MATVEAAPRTAPAVGCRLRNAKTAMLVIHGIGEQNPYDTLDSFARGVFSFLRDQCRMNVTLEPCAVAHRDWTEVHMRVRVNPAAADATTGLVDIYEYYWAPDTEDKISLVQTLAWLIRSDLSPLQHLASNLQEMASDDPKKTRARFFWLFFREIRRIVLLYVPLATIFIWLLDWCLHRQAIVRPLPAIVQGPGTVPSWLWLASLVSYGLCALMVLFFIGTAIDLFRRNGPSIEPHADLVWFVCAFASALGFYWGGDALGGALGAWIASLVATMEGWVRALLGGYAHQVAPYLKAAVPALAAGLSYFLTKYVADIAVYVNADAKAGSYAARTKILDESTAALARLLINEDYDHVILAGHSLGSVIAYDTVDELIDTVSAAPDPTDRPAIHVSRRQLEKLHGLVTFGSPLDKVYYFFREHVKEDQAIRAQILSMLHSFRRAPSHRDYGEYEFHYTRPAMRDLVWLNVWSPLDPVSAYLHFYEVDQQKRFWYWLPVLAHLSYWRDPRFFSFLGKRLLVTGP